MDTVISNSVDNNSSESEDARKIYATCKNKWRWSWLEEKDENGDYQLILGKLMLVTPHFISIVINL